MTELLSEDHTILERPFMEFPPLGVDGYGVKIRDISGTIVKANVDGLPPATASHRACMVEGDEWSEWDVTWEPAGATGLSRIIKRLFPLSRGGRIGA